MSRIIETSPKITITDANDNGQLDDGDTVYVPNPETNLPEATSVSTFWSGGNLADRLQLLAQSTEQEIKYDRFSKTHPLE